MRFHVLVQRSLVLVLLLTLTALKLFLIAVHQHVHLQVVFPAEPPVTLMAPERLLLGVGSHVPLVPGFVPEKLNVETRQARMRLSNAVLFRFLYVHISYLYLRS